jgi:hypothetical protein
VPASAHRHLQPHGACEVEGGRNIAGAEAANNDRGPAIDQGIEAATQPVIPGIGWGDDRTRHGPLEFGPAPLRSLDSLSRISRLRSQGRCDLAHDELEALPVIGRVGGKQEITRAEFGERQQSLDALLGREDEEGRLVDRQLRCELAPTCPQGGLVLGDDRAERE